jgi:hypothetical protein
VASHHFLVARYQILVAHHHSAVVSHQILVAHHQIPVVHHHSAVASHHILVAHYQNPVANHQKVVATIKFSWLLPESCGRAAARSPIAAPPIHSPLQLPIRRQRHTHHITAQGDIRRLDLRTRCSWVFTIVPWGAVGHTQNRERGPWRMPFTWG